MGELSAKFNVNNLIITFFNNKKALSSLKGTSSNII